MADLQGFIQEARQLMPYTDEEIRELYVRATASPAVHSPAASLPPQVRNQFNFSEDVSFDATVNAVVSGLLCLVVFQTNDAFVYAGILGLGVWTLCALMGEFDHIVGFKTYFARKERIGPRTQTLSYKQPSRIDVSDPLILSTVMQYLSREPIAASERLQREIVRQRAKIQNSVHDLKGALATLDTELLTCTNEDVRLLLLGQKTAAEDFSKQLLNADAILAEQDQQAKDAIAPVQDVINRIASISRISSTLDRVRAAHDVIDQSYEAISTNRMELSLLAQVSNVALARLKDLEGLVKANQNAQLELESSTRKN